MPSATATTMQVYTPGFHTVLTLPVGAVQHLPIGVPTSFLVLCTRHTTASGCPLGAGCKFVHADASRATQERAVHINYAWHSLEEVSYERLPAGRVLRVAPPNSRVAVDVMDSTYVLATKALVDAQKLTHCAHYYFNRACNLGPDCQFVHAVFIDPDAKLHQRAPAPSQRGEGRELQLSKKQREAIQDTSSQRIVPGSVSKEAPALAPTAPVATSVATSVASSRSSCSDEMENCTGLHQKKSASSQPQSVYRHDPYSLCRPLRFSMASDGVHSPAKAIAARA